MNMFFVLVLTLAIATVMFKIVFYIKEKIFINNLSKEYTIHYSYKEKVPHMYLDEDKKKVFIYKKEKIKPIIFDYNDLVDVRVNDNHEAVLVDDQPMEDKKSSYKTMVGTRTNDGVVVGTVFENRKKQKQQPDILKQRELYYHFSITFDFKKYKFTYTFINTKTLNDSDAFKNAMESYERLLDFGSHIWYGKDK